LVKETFEVWNALADGVKLPRCLTVSDKRRRTIEARARDGFFAANWRAAMDKVCASEFCKGKSERGWVATFDWFIQPDSVAKIMEGKYDNRTGTKISGRSNPRLEGVSRNNAVNNYATAKPRLAGQMAPSADAPPQAGGA
jgi:hypothetical protein